MTSIALVVLDTVRYDAFCEAFEWLDGTWFHRAYSTSHWTVPAHASLFTGQYASEVGVQGTAPELDCPDRTVAEALQDAGYRTRGLTANPQLQQYDGWERGFDVFDGAPNLGRTDSDILDWEALVSATDPGTGRYLAALWRCLVGDCDTVRSLRYGYGLSRTPSFEGGARAVRRRLEATEVGDEEFLFVNLMDAHTPYYPPSEGTDPVTVVIADALAGQVTDPEAIRRAYRRSVAHLADVYRDIYATLESAFDYVITLSDHGEHLGEHGLWNHSVGLHPELIQIPLVISGDGDSKTHRDELVSLLDVHRTVGRLAGVDLDSRGRDLRSRLDPREFLFESHGLLPFHRSQFERKEVPTEQFLRWQTPLAGFVDPDGAYCYQSDPDSFRVLGDSSHPEPETHLEDLLDTLDRRPVESSEPSVSAEVRERLAELGYA